MTTPPAAPFTPSELAYIRSQVASGEQAGVWGEHARWLATLDTRPSAPAAEAVAWMVKNGGEIVGVRTTRAQADDLGSVCEEDGPAWNPVVIPLFAHPPSAEARAAVVEECARAIEEFDPLELSTDWDSTEAICSAVQRRAAAVVRALKSLPPAAPTGAKE